MVKRDITTLARTLFLAVPIALLLSCVGQTTCESSAYESICQRYEHADQLDLLVTLTASPGDVEAIEQVQTRFLEAADNKKSAEITLLTRFTVTPQLLLRVDKQAFVYLTAQPDVESIMINDIKQPFDK